MPFQHVLNSGQFEKADLEYIFALSEKIRLYNDSTEGLMYLRSLLPHKRAMLFFSQPSTRTFLSFQAACHILGIQTSDIRDPNTSSEKKGETIEDSLRTFASYVDIIIMRSAVAGLCEKIALALQDTKSNVPIINAGSGPDEHPTQALLDLYTLTRGFKLNGGLQNKTICMVGDLKRGRTVRSLSLLLRHFADIKIIFCSPHEFKIGDDICAKLDQHPNVSYTHTTNFLDSISSADAIYMTRIQDEYDTAQSSLSSIDVSSYYLKHEHLNILKPTCKILHPMPRRLELDPLIDQDPRAQYWQQQRNGMWLRTSLIAILLGADKAICDSSESQTKIASAVTSSLTT